jgi:hypothetical protein
MLTDFRHIGIISIRTKPARVETIMVLYKSIRIATLAAVLGVGSGELQGKQTGEFCSILDKDGTKISTYSKGYGAGLELRGEITQPKNNGIERTHFIVKEKVLYIWKESQNKGFISPVEESGARKEIPGNITDKKNTNCRVWEVDDSKFEVPKDMTWEPLKKQ